MAPWAGNGDRRIPYRVHIDRIDLDLNNFGLLFIVAWRLGIRCLRYEASNFEETP